MACSVFVQSFALLYKLLLLSMITNAAPVRSTTSQTNYRPLQVYQSKCLRVIEDFPRRTPISNLHAHLQMIPIRQFIYHLTHRFFVSCPAHPNPLIHNIGNYTLEQRFSNFFQVGTTFISQNVLRTTLLLGLSNSLGLP